jgi:aspartate ammonia-lyase
MEPEKFRLEKDFLGEKNVPKDAYYGIHTQRALENFSLTGYSVPLCLIKALGMVKKACCLANTELGYIPVDKSKAIVAACDEIIEGKLDGAFKIDALQGGAGTATNMNVNEVIANRALEILGHEKGCYEKIHPLEDVNRHQSTNDVYPTALKIAFIFGLRVLAEKIARLQGVFQKKEKEFRDIVKIGRTELQEAVPMTFGAEFGAFAEAIGRDRWRTAKCEERLRVVNIGGTAIGTGLSAPKKYIFLVIEKLRQVTGLGLARAETLVDATANTDVFVETSGILKAHASSLVKIANDLRILNLLKEITLPALAAGSSVMPGKLNPVVLEAAVQAGLRVMANDFLVTEAVSRSTLQINEFLPLLSFAILESVDLLGRTDELLAKHLEGLEVDAARAKAHFEESPMLVTAFIPHIGYDRASEILKEFAASKENNLKGFLNKKLGKDLVAKVLSSENLTSLGYKDERNNP